jgi:hypothetical protein
VRKLLSSIVAYVVNIKVLSMRICVCVGGLCSRRHTAQHTTRENTRICMIFSPVCVHSSTQRRNERVDIYLKLAKRHVASDVNQIERIYIHFWLIRGRPIVIC